VVYSLNVRPWFSSTPRSLANRANAAGIMAVCLVFAMTDIVVRLSGGHGTWVKAATPFLIVCMVVAMCLLFLAFNEERLRSLLKPKQHHSKFEPIGWMLAGCVIYGLLIVDLLSHRPNG
jgi:hypothetical protein